MKYALSSRQDPEYLAQADEINVEYRDRDYVFDLIEKFPDKKYVLNLMTQWVTYREIDWDLLAQFKRITNNLILRVPYDTSLLVKCAEESYQFFCGTPIIDWAVLLPYAQLEPCYIIPGGELFFRLDDLKKFNIPIRITANFVDVPHLIDYVTPDRDLTLLTSWIRPEDVDAYAQYVDVIEFYFTEKSQEQALFRIYAKAKSWPGSLQLLIPQLKTDATNRLINSTIFQTRLNCKRDCLYHSPCRICDRCFALANYERLKEYQGAAIDN